jgi:hypothetical protein
MHEGVENVLFCRHVYLMVLADTLDTLEKSVYRCYYTLTYILFSESFFW